MTETRKLSLSAIFPRVDFATDWTFQVKSNSTSNLNLRLVFNEAPWFSVDELYAKRRKIVLIFFPDREEGRVIYILQKKKEKKRKEENFCARKGKSSEKYFCSIRLSLKLVGKKKKASLRGMLPVVPYLSPLAKFHPAPSRPHYHS